MLLAEDLLLLVTDDTSGRLSAPAAQVDVGLGGANLLELTLLNRVDLSREGDEGKPGRIVVRDPSPTGEDRQGNWAYAAVRKVIDDMIAAVAAAATVAAAGSAAAAG